jgi:rRNA maturation endonuclease Nob1
MGFFNRVGRQVEQFTQTAKDVADQNADYQCRACDERFHAERDQCPECGSEAVVARTTEE